MERRKHTRIDGEIEASIIINNETEAVVQVQNVSASGIAFYYGEPIVLGDHIIARFDGGVRLEGDVVRLFDGGFAISLAMSMNKRKRLVDTLDRAQARGHAIDRLNLDRRLATRVTGMRQSVICETEDKQISVRIIDMSLTGVAIETDEPLEMGSLVVVGKMRGTVVREEGNRYGIEFLVAQECINEADNSPAATPPQAAPRRRA